MQETKKGNEANYDQRENKHKMRKKGPFLAIRTVLSQENHSAVRKINYPFQGHLEWKVESEQPALSDGRGGGIASHNERPSFHFFTE
jgi:hypothetical protein